MSGVNKVILVGNLGKDPEVRHLESGVAVANFSLATSESYKDRTTGERKTITEWHNVVLWRGLAEVAEKYLKKGDQIYVEGRLRTRSWESESGTKYTTEVVGDNLTMLGGRRSTESGEASQPTSTGPSEVSQPTSTGQSEVSQPTSTRQTETPSSPSQEVPAQIQSDEEDDLPF